MSSALNYIDGLTAKGYISFTVDEMCRVLGISQSAALNAIQRLKVNKHVVSPCKGYYLILTPEFRKQGCLPADQFIDDLAQHWKVEYYVGLLSAALYHGAAHQQPQLFQVMLPIKKNNIDCGTVHIEFIQSMYCAKMFTQSVKTRTGYMLISTPEVTAMDLLKYIRQSGGIGRIATVLDELGESMNKASLVKLVNMSEEYAWKCRLGFLFDELGYGELSDAIYSGLHTRSKEFVPLVPYAKKVGRLRNKKWRLIINATIESDLNDPD